MPVLQRCRRCGALEGFTGLVSGLCPECSQRRIVLLANLEQSYRDAVSRGDPSASPAAARLFRDYARSEAARTAQIREFAG